MSYPSKKRGHDPAWSIRGGYSIAIPDEPTRWEKFLTAEGLEGKELNHNSKIREFVYKNAHRFYVPLKVLEFYGVNVDE